MLTGASRSNIILNETKHIAKTVIIVKIYKVVKLKRKIIKKTVEIVLYSQYLGKMSKWSYNTTYIIIIKKCQNLI